MIADREGQSGPDGRYAIESVPAGTYPLSGTKVGYATATIDAEIRPGIVNFWDLELIAPRPVGLTVTTSALPAATIGVGYQAELEAAGGTPPYIWSWSSSSPPGLILDASGLVTGTPGYPAGVYSISVSVIDAENRTVTKTVNIEFVDPTGLEITSLQLKTAEAGTPYADTLEATGGTGPYTFEWSEPFEVAGLSLEALTGAISGNPERPSGPAGEFVNVDVSVHDAGGASAIATVTIGIRPGPLVMNTDELPNGQVGAQYEGSLSATGGYGNKTWIVVAGALPPGLGVQSESLFGSRVAGVPTLAGTYTFALRVQDDVDEATREFTVEIE